MSASAQARRDELDRDLDQAPVSHSLGGELFAVVDALESSSALRRALSDPAAAAEAKAGLANRVFGPRVSPEAVGVITKASALHWSTPQDLVSALERQAVRAELRLAEQSGGLAGVNEELFRFGRTIASDRGLRDAIENRNAPLELRERLVDQLLRGKVGEGTVRLAKRALRARERTVAMTLDSYGELGAELANRTIAKITAAKPLDADQATRLQAALSRLAGRAVEMQVEVDPEVLGGLRVQIGDQIIEGTVAGRLEDARRQIA
ncbi:F0F1 ATP synthase subunit delta [Aestuariimicrobium sp. p3-SID1156]|uniref:F0F1 ATP synthase subunit delta n=1 Tax=Aestuariimicrobium sp. p3-SID1156 TaxID=2916038 RepID=UPI00223A6B60|nr:F0F1 ATP synthase subunit delta [Aestuariimicrobium sp. p3-SID1156]MCT1459444.1 F0F1 ATP synthase subunit delta [Aestuariimicrobium sp. p3-SID1156]